MQWLGGSVRLDEWSVIIFEPMQTMPLLLTPPLLIIGLFEDLKETILNTAQALITYNVCRQHWQTKIELKYFPPHHGVIIHQ